MLSQAIAKHLGLATSASESVIIAALEKADKEKAEKEKAEAEKAKKFDASVKKMSAKHRAYMAHPDATMPKGGKEAFSEMEPGERDEHMSKHPIEDEDEDGEVEKAITKGTAFRTSEGVVLRKSDFGSQAGFDFAKSQNARLIKAEKERAEEKEKADEKDRKAKAEKSLTLIGKADAVGGLLHRIAKFSPALADEVEVLLKGANDAIGAGNVLKEFGSGARAVAGSAADEIARGATQLLTTEPALKTIEKARVEFRKRNPAVAKREQEEAAAARKAAA